MTRERPKGATSDLGPFGIVPRWALGALAGNTTAQAVYAWLATYADRESGECWPLQSTLADGIGISTDTLQRAIGALEAAGLVSIVPRLAQGRKVGNQYRVAFAQPPAPSTETATVRHLSDSTETATVRHRQSRSGAASREQTREQTKPRTRDLLFDAVASACGWREPFTASAAARIAKAKKELAAVDATPREVEERAREWKRRNAWRKSGLDPQTLVAAWPSLGAGQPEDRPDWQTVEHELEARARSEREEADRATS